MLLGLNLILLAAKLISPYSFYSDMYNPDVFFPLIMIVSIVMLIAFAVLERKKLDSGGKLLCSIISAVLLIVSAVLYTYHSGYKFTYHEFKSDTNEDVVLVIKEDHRIVGNFVSFYTKENSHIIKKMGCSFITRYSDSLFDDPGTKITWVDDKSFTFEFPYKEGEYSKYLIGTDGSRSEVKDQ